MPLTLLTGPAGSGKTGEVLERFAAALAREPVLVVPTRADAERFEDELIARRPVALGGLIVTFERLFGLAADAAGVVAPAPLTATQRRMLLTSVVRAGDLRVLAEPARRVGFVDALDGFVQELQAALVPPRELERRLDRMAGPSQGRRRYLAEVSSLYAGYLKRRDALGRSDARSIAAAAIEGLRRDPGAWGDRPLIVHGFDDLSPAQLALVEAIAHGADVLVSVVHEPERASLAARERLVKALEALDAAAPEAIEPPGASGAQLSLADAGGTAHAEEHRGPARIALERRDAGGLLSHLERHFLTDAPARMDPDGALLLLAAAGRRNEVEQVGAEIMRLLRDGAAPDEIAVIARSVEAVAPLVEEVFERFGIPFSIAADRPVASTPGGRGLVGLLRAALEPAEGAADLVAFLRAPGGPPPSMVDRLERSLRVDGIESADEALVRWEELGGRRPREIDTLREAAARPALLDRAAAVARHLAERPHRRSAPVLGPRDRAHLLAAESAAGALAEMAQLAALDPGLAPPHGDLPRLVERLTAPRSAGGVAGRVEIMSPYRVRARQFPYVFLVSLQEGEFPRSHRDDPFLDDDERAGAGLPPRALARDEERYLFYVCLTRATRRLHLSFRTADEEGGAATRSFLVEEVLDLLPPGCEEGITRSKGLSRTVFEPATAPTARELARALAERRLEEPPPALGASTPLADHIRPALAGAARRADRLPGSIRVPFVRERFAGKRLIGASSLETYAECSFRYFVQHELRPGELAPRPEPLTRGGLTHTVLERLYEEHGRPTPETLPAALERARTILAEVAAGSSLSPARPAARAVYRRMQSDIERFLRYDADHGSGAVLGIEASFGAGEEDDRPPLELEGFQLHGKIDRIDEVAPGSALIRDYKTGATVPSRKEIVEQKRLQLPLYMLAVRELWGLEPVGGVYHPLGDQKEHRPRGLIRGPREASGLEEPFVKGDFTADEDQFEELLLAGRTEAEALARRIHSGHLDRDPLGGSCPRHCDFHPICRRERGEKVRDEGEPREEDEGDA